ncbi:hypothetical protein EJB05_47846, partial [Eragrostis curvula]
MTTSRSSRAAPTWDSSSATTRRPSSATMTTRLRWPRPRPSRRLRRPSPTGRSPASPDGAIVAAGRGPLVLDAQQVFEEQEEMSKVSEANGKEESISMVSIT